MGFLEKQIEQSRTNGHNKKTEIETNEGTDSRFAGNDRRAGRNPRRIALAVATRAHAVPAKRRYLRLHGTALYIIVLKALSTLRMGDTHK